MGEIDVVNVLEDMKKLEKALGDEWKNNQTLIESKAKATSDYDGAIAIDITSLKASGHPTTIIPQLAKGDCRQELYDKILAEEMLKAHYVRIDILRSQLSAKKGVLEKFNLI